MVGEVFAKGNLINFQTNSDADEYLVDSLQSNLDYMAGLILING
jgi:hypothetical protein